MEKQQINKFENNAANKVFAGCLSPSLVCIATIILAVLLGSCKTRERIVAVNAVRTDTVRLSSSTRDSIYLHDSIYIRDKGDTVWLSVGIPGGATVPSTTRPTSARQTACRYRTRSKSRCRVNSHGGRKHCSVQEASRSSCYLCG